MYGAEGKGEEEEEVVSYHLCCTSMPESSVATAGTAGWWNVALKIPSLGNALDDRAMVTRYRALEFVDDRSNIYGDTGRYHIYSCKDYQVNWLPG